MAKCYTGACLREAFAGWAELHAPLPVVVGLDANGPRYDTVGSVTFHDEREQVLFGFDGAPLTDAYRASLTTKDLATLQRLRPEGPLVVTHMAGGRSPRRYDHILVRDCEVTHAAYVVADALAAGSDHALAYAALDLA